MTRPCNQALGSIYTHRTGLLLLLFRGTLLVLRLVIMGLSLMLLCRGYSPEGVGESEIFSFSIFLYFFFLHFKFREESFWRGYGMDLDLDLDLGGDFVFLVDA